MQIFVETSDGKTTAPEVKSSETTNDLTVRIEGKEGIPINQQSLVFAGKQLEDGLSLSLFIISKKNHPFF
ncbi:ubiquitin [Lactarius hatsudake]|nr:ubiquitin [Lactarius hatsudake]